MKVHTRCASWGENPEEIVRKRSAQMDLVQKEIAGGIPGKAANKATLQGT